MADRPSPPDGADRQPGEGVAPGHDKQGLDERLDRLNRSLDDRREREAAEAGRSGKGSGYAQAVKLSSEFIAGVLVGAALGWLFDHWLGTSPWGLIVFLLLGFMAGILNLLRSAGVVAEPGTKTPGTKAPGTKTKDRDAGSN